MREGSRSKVVGRRSERSVKGGYRDLLAWQLGMDLVRLIYALTKEFPSHGGKLGLLASRSRCSGPLAYLGIATDLRPTTLDLPQ